MTLRVLLLGTFSILLTLTFAFRTAAQTCVDPPTHLMHWWPGEGNAHDIVGGADGEVHGADFMPAKVGYGFRFEGGDEDDRNGDYVAFGTEPAIVGLQDFTVDAWIKTTDTHGVIIQQRHPGFDGEYLLSVGGIVWPRFANDPGKVCWTSFGNMEFGYNFCSDTRVNDGEFHHVAVTRQADGEGRIYIDGELDSQQDAPLRTLVPFEVFLGGDLLDNLRYLAGVVDEVQIYGRALTELEIQSIYDAGDAGQCFVIDVEIDIKPDGFPNSINPSSNGVIPVAILTTETYDARNVDPATVQFGRDTAYKAHGSAHLEDVDGDGDLDLLLHFRTQETGIHCGDRSATLTAATFPGVSIEASDSIRTVGCQTGGDSAASSGTKKSKKGKKGK